MTSSSKLLPSFAALLALQLVFFCISAKLACDGYFTSQRPGKQNLEPAQPSALLSRRSGRDYGSSTENNEVLALNPSANSLGVHRGVQKLRTARASGSPWVTALPTDKNAFPRTQAEDIFSFGLRKAEGGKPLRVALVTMGVKGFTKFGGIGTMFYNYVHFFASRGFEVHLYYTYTHAKDFKNVTAEYFDKTNIHVHLLQSDHFPNKVYGTKEMDVSNKVYLTLKDDMKQYDFETIVFHDYRGIATSSIQAKRAGIAFQDTLLVVTCHTSSYNAAFFNGRPTSKDDSVLNEMEDYTRNFADVVVFVSQALFDQMQKLSIYQGLDPPARKVVLPNFLYGDLYGELYSSVSRDESNIVKPTKFAFFGRIDNLKGIEVFLSACESMVDSAPKTRLQEVAIVGDYPLKDFQAISARIDRFTKKMTKAGIKVQQYNDLMTTEAVRTLRDNKYVAVTPSLYETYSMALLELLTFGVPVIHADAGGQSEVAKFNHNMFRAGDASDLARLMRKRMAQGLTKDVPAIPRSEVLDSYDWLVQLDPHALSTRSTATEDCSDVTIGVVTFEQRLANATDLLMRLSKQSCAASEILLYINTPCHAQSTPCGAFPRQAELSQAGLRVRVMTPPGDKPSTVSEARNHLVQSAQTEYIVLFDDDDVPRNDFVEVLRGAAERDRGDLVTSHAGFVLRRPSEQDVSASTVPLHHVSLAAGNTGPASNFFVHHTGKANVLLRTAVAQELGPCSPEFDLASSPFVDWGMYTNFILNKKRVTVVPEPMYYYLMESTGSIFYGSTDFTKYLGAKKIVNQYCQHYDLDVMGCELLWMAKQMSLVRRT